MIMDNRLMNINLDNVTTNSDIIVSKNFNDLTVETIIRDDQIFFKVADVVKILEIDHSTASKWFQRDWFDADEIISVTNCHIGGKPRKYVAESGLYRILNRVNSLKAKPFERWVTKEVLPSIRKNGGYIMGQENATTELEILANAIMVAKNVIDKKSRELELIQTQMEKDRPKVEFAEEVMESNSTLSVGDFAKLLSNKDFKIGQNKLFKWLRYMKILKANNIPYQQYINNGWFEIIEQIFKTGDGRPLINLKPVITGKGQVALTKKIKESYSK